VTLSEQWLILLRLSSCTAAWPAIFLFSGLSNVCSQFSGHIHLRMLKTGSKQLVLLLRGLVRSKIKLSWMFDKYLPAHVGPTSLLQSYCHHILDFCLSDCFKTCTTEYQIYRFWLRRCIPDGRCGHTQQSQLYAWTLHTVLRSSELGDDIADQSSASKPVLCHVVTKTRPWQE